jgi:hypothetical protein
VINFEHTQPRMRIAIGKSIESRAEDNILSYTVSDGPREFVFGVAAAGRHECAEGAGESVVLFRIGSKIVCGLSADDPQSERIVENFGLIQQLVRGPANRHPMRSLAEFAFLHFQIPSGQPCSALTPQFRPRRFAFLARADLAQKFPGINAEIVVVVPREPDCIFSNSFGGNGFGCGFEHGQHTRS